MADCRDHSQSVPHHEQYQLFKVCILSLQGISAVTFLTAAHLFKDCGSRVGTINSVELNGCYVNGEECEFRRGNCVTLTIGFTPYKNITDIKIIAHGYIYGFPIPIPLNNTNACIESGLSCPLEAGYVYNYSSTMKVYELCPKIRGNVHLELIDNIGERLACVEFTGKVI